MGLLVNFFIFFFFLGNKRNFLLRGGWGGGVFSVCLCALFFKTIELDVSEI